jgi:acetyl-CoA carboxylase biotin carboxyl carrier protein
MTTRTTAKRKNASASRSRTGRGTGSSTSRASQKNGSSSTSRKTTKVAKQAAAKTTTAKASTAAKPVAKSVATTSRASVRTGDLSAADTIDMVRELAAVVESHGLAEVIVDLPSATLTLRRHVSGAASAAAPILAAAAPAVAAPPAPAPQVQAEAPAEAKADAKPTGHLVTSPFVGTFYRSPNPDSAPYVEVGARVEKGQPLCIVEAMKLMNEIEADQSGVIAAILVENAEPVEYGQPLFEIVPG